jgi:hypothetical protein
MVTIAKHRTQHPNSSGVSPAAPFFHPKLTINQPNDPFEQQADAMAAQVMRMPGNDQSQSFFPAKPSIQKKCSHCEQEERLQKKSDSNGGGMNVPSSVHEVIGSSGQSLDAGTRNFMESRFGYDFTNVQIHNDSLAHQSSSDIQAKAYTHANHIAFASGQYQPQTNSGRELLAHELTHVIQQQGTSPALVSREVDDSSVCSNKVDTAALPEPLIFIELADMMAGAHLSMAILKLKLDMTTTSGIPSGETFDAYQNRFGDPQKVKGKFKDRFFGSLHDNMVDAQISEMKSLIKMLERVQSILDKGISYQCMGTSARKFGGVTFSKCKTDVIAKASGGLHAIMICPDFWSTTSDHGIVIIHELFHIAFGFGDHDKAPFAQTSTERLTEPQCYAGFVADVNKVNEGDISCPAIVKP